MIPCSPLPLRRDLIRHNIFPLYLKKQPVFPQVNTGVRIYRKNFLDSIQRKKKQLYTLSTKLFKHIIHKPASSAITCKKLFYYDPSSGTFLHYTFICPFGFLWERRTTVSICVSLSKLIFISSSIIGSLNLIDLSHCPFSCRSGYI